MAPDRGTSSNHSETESPRNHELHDEQNVPADRGVARESEARAFLAKKASQPQNFTLRGVLVGLAIGVVICFSNMYFGLQTGWVSGMAMPSALIGFAYFKTVSRLLKFPFTPVENVLVQSVAGSVGTMPLGCGFVGVIPALNFLLAEDENGPLNISLWRLIIWSVGICFFGVVFAVPLRREVIIREKLKFPSGTATALMIRVLHGDEKSKNVITQPSNPSAEGVEEEERLLQPSAPEQEDYRMRSSSEDDDEARQEQELAEDGDWKAKIRLLIISFAGSALYVCASTAYRNLTDESRPSFHTLFRIFTTFPSLDFL
jgi:OPT family oligopeptide transporter